MIEVWEKIGVFHFLVWLLYFTSLTSYIFLLFTVGIVGAGAIGEEVPEKGQCPCFFHAYLCSLAGISTVLLDVL